MAARSQQCSLMSSIGLGAQVQGKEELNPFSSAVHILMNVFKEAKQCRGQSEINRTLSK